MALRLRLRPNAEAVGMRARWRLGRMRESWDNVSTFPKRAAPLRCAAPFTPSRGLWAPGRWTQHGVLPGAALGGADTAREQTES